ncbi:NDR1/HIN1-like protein 13 [Carica papaya]|uniref:NDR1/HIN1-like protein 13 n=1 Tax=Carica papaya TaxID=3649 RepID=UPI000B8CCDCE|nr:NDR1/HIN1-like protein 13 [Carica papaya]
MEGRVSPSTAPADDDKPDDPPIYSPIFRQMTAPVHPTSAADNPSWRRLYSFNPTNPSAHLRTPTNPNDPSVNWRKLSVHSPLPSPTPANSISNDPPRHWRRPSLNGTNLPLAPPPDNPQELETYVVQVPKDQIYRVPPPENAKYVEQFKNTTKNERSPHCRRFLWVFIVVIALLIMIGAIVVTLKVVYNPKAPTFTIVKLSLQKPIPKPSYDTQLYKISLKVNNLNEKTGLDYNDDEGGGVKLYFKNHKLGEGNFPEIAQDAKALTTINFELADGLMQAPKSKTALLVLNMNVRLGIRVGSWILWSKNLGVTCDMKVTELGVKTTILSQKCHSQFK